jgi:hypothetical protein
MPINKKICIGSDTVKARKIKRIAFSQSVNGFPVLEMDNPLHIFKTAQDTSLRDERPCASYGSSREAHLP